MLQQIRTDAATTRIRSAAESSLTTSQIRDQLTQLMANGGKLSGLASQVLTLLENGSDTSSSLTSALSVLLQQSAGNDTQLSTGLSQILAQFTASSSGTGYPSVKELGSLLLSQLNQQAEGREMTSVEKQSAALLRQLSQGNVSDGVQQKLEQVLQQLRQSSSPVSQQNISTELQTLLQQVSKELNAAGQAQDAAVAKNLTEFALRLNQSAVTDDAARLAQSGYLVTGRQAGSDQQQSQQQEQNNEDDEESALSPVAATTTVNSKMTRSALTSEEISALTKSSLSVSSGSVSVTSTTSSSLLQGDSVFSQGLNVLYLFMQMLSDQANNSYSQMQNNSTISQQAQSHSSAVDGKLATVSASGNKDATESLSQETLDYIKDNHLEIDGVCGYDTSTGDWKWMDDDMKFDQGQLTAIKGALDNLANRASDFISTAQLQLQKMMQTYNVCVSLINSLQTMLADMNKTIAQGIR